MLPRRAGAGQRVAQGHRWRRSRSVADHRPAGVTYKGLLSHVGLRQLSVRCQTHRLSCQLACLRRRLLQPEPHVHLAVHRRRGREVPSGVIALACAPVQLDEIEVAAGDDRAHPSSPASAMACSSEVHPGATGRCGAQDEYRCPPPASRVSVADGSEPPVPVRSQQPPRGWPTARTPCVRLAGSSGGPSPTPHSGRRGGPDVRRARSGVRSSTGRSRASCWRRWTASSRARRPSASGAGPRGTCPARGHVPGLRGRGPFPARATAPSAVAIPHRAGAVARDPG